MSGRDPQDGQGDGGAGTPRTRLVQITLDETSISRSNPNVVHEREVAIYDILDGNTFEVVGRDDGPYTLVLSLVEDRLVFTLSPAEPPEPFSVVLALSGFRRVIKDYFAVCDTYYQAIRNAPPSRIQTIDMGRRALHDEGSRLLVERLDGRIRLDHPTARRLFTLICALHWKG